MRLIVILLFFCASAFGQFASYNFDETSGTTADDGVGANDGTIDVGVSMNQSGKVGTAFIFSGANNSKVTLPDAADFQFTSNNFSLRAWVKATSLPQSKNGILGGEDDAAWLYVTSSGYLGFGRRNFGDATTSTLQITDYNWHCVQISYNNGTNTLIYGLDGSYESITYDVTFSAGAATNLIGAGYLNVDKWVGTIDEVAYWSSALTSGNLLTDYETFSEAALAQYEVATHDKEYNSGTRVYFYDKTYGAGAKIKTYSFPQVSDVFDGQVLYVDYSGGNDANDGLSETSAIKTLAQAQTLLSNDFKYLVLSDETHPGTISITGITRPSYDPLIVTTWHKYGVGPATIDGRKTLGTFTQAGNYWKIVDSQLPAGTSDPNTNYINPTDYEYYVTFMNGIYIDGNFYKLSKYPYEKRYLKMEAKASGNTYMDDTDSTWASGYWTGAWLATESPTWIESKVYVSNYNGSRFTITNVNDEEFYNVSTNGLDGHKYFLLNHKNATKRNGQWYSKPANDSLVVYYSTDLNTHVIKAPIQDILLNISTSQYVTIDGVNFIGSNQEHVKAFNNTGIVIENCTFYDAPYAAVYARSNIGFTFTNNIIQRSGDNGVVAKANTNTIIEYNTFNEIGTDETFGGDKNTSHYCGVMATMGSGTLDINYNDFDSVAYCAIMVSAHNSTANDQVLVYQNKINNAMMTLSDGGAIYTHGNNNNYYKRIRGNLVLNTYNNQGFHRDDITESRGIYLDTYGQTGGDNKIWIIDSNYVYKAPQATFTNSDAYPNTYRNNEFIDDTYRGSERYAMRLREIGAGIYNSTWTRNKIVLSDSASLGMYWSWPGGSQPANGNVVDSNDYYNPFREVEDAIWLEYISGLTSRDLTYVRANSTYEDNGTFNKTGWTFKDVTGITASQFIWFFYNWSDAAHVFSLGSATFKDLEGVSKSGTISVAAKKGICLMYVSGSLSGITTSYP